MPRSVPQNIFQSVVEETHLLHRQPLSEESEIAQFHFAGTANPRNLQLDVTGLVARGFVYPAIIIVFVCPLIYLAKWLLTRRNPLRKERGMSLYYEIADWVGGYPYEYATVGEINELMNALGFRLQRYISAPVSTGCNQFVFQRE